MSRILFNVMSWRRILLVCAAFAFTASVLPAAAEAQTVSTDAATAGTVSGVVLDENGEPLIGATVMVKDTPVGATTDIDGNYTIRASAGATLHFSYIGYQPKDVKVTDSKLDITLAPDQQVLSEVVVVGYGTQKKATMTGSVTAIGSEALDNKGHFQALFRHCRDRFQA